MRVDTSEVSGSHPPSAGFTSPLILIGDGEVLLFQTMQEVALAIEPVDALEAEFKLFDAHGLVLTVEGVDVHRTRFTVSGGRTVVSIAEPQRERPDVLASELREHLTRVFGVSEKGAELRSLVDQAKARIGFS